ncbi:MAG: aromatic ring-hydroxylating dioxygenase subunit alpha [Reyranella sp.]|nr:aromatic ring-hydroxylating dioxygenase subunit alpha [Reyranella sp.]
MRVPEDHWYPVLDSREVRRRPLGCERLGRRLVFWRTSDGRAQAHLDRCPHLGAALSGGQVRGDRLVCPFHGLEFDAGGVCRHLPAVGRAGRIADNMALKGFPLREAHGLLWLWHGAPRDVYPEVPYFAELSEGWRYGTVTADWPVHYSRAIENQLDVAHLAFVHRTSIGAGGQSLVDGPHVEADRRGIRVWVSNRRDDGRSPHSAAQLAAASAGTEPTLTLLFPGLWRLNIRPRLKNVIAFVPVNERTTRYYLRVYHRHRNPLIARPFEALMGIANRFILNQDRRVVVTQTPADSAEARGDRLIGTDLAISQYRRLQAELLARPAERWQAAGR